MPALPPAEASRAAGRLPVAASEPLLPTCEARGEATEREPGTHEDPDHCCDERAADEEEDEDGEEEEEDDDEEAIESPFIRPVAAEPSALPPLTLSPRSATPPPPPPWAPRVEEAPPVRVAPLPHLVPPAAAAAAVPPPPRPAREPPQQRARSDAVLRLQRSMAGRLLLAQLHARTPEQLQGLRSSRVRRVVEQLRRYVAAAVLVGTLALTTALWLAVRTSSAFVASREPQCHGPMRDWLRSYLLLLFAVPTTFPLVVLVRRIAPSMGRRVLHMVWPTTAFLLLGWSMAAVVFLQPPPACPALRGLAWEALTLQLAHIILLVISGMCILAAQPLVKRLNEMLARGTLLAEAANLAVEVPVDELPDSQECVICLGCMEDDEEETGGSDDDLEPSSRGLGLEMEEGRLADGSLQSKERPRWRQTRCGHRFHEQCLFEWLRKARAPAAKRCPVCRSRLKQGRGSSRRHRRHASATGADATTTASSSSPAFAAVAAGVAPLDLYLIL